MSFRCGFIRRHAAWTFTSPPGLYLYLCPSRWCFLGVRWLGVKHQVTYLLWVRRQTLILGPSRVDRPAGPQSRIKLPSSRLWVCTSTCLGPSDGPHRPLSATTEWPDCQVEQDPCKFLANDPSRVSRTWEITLATNKSDGCGSYGLVSVASAVPEVFATP